MDTPKKDRKKKKDKKEDKNERKEKRENRKRKKELKQKDSTISHACFGGAMKFKDNWKLVKREDYENEQLERSGITEELDQPVSSPQEPYSSDSTQSSKRKRCTLLPNQDHGGNRSLRNLLTALFITVLFKPCLQNLMCTTL